MRLWKIILEKDFFKVILGRDRDRLILKKWDLQIPNDEKVKLSKIYEFYYLYQISFKIQREAFKKYSNEVSRIDITNLVHKRSLVTTNPADECHSENKTRLVRENQIEKLSYYIRVTFVVWYLLLLHAPFYTDDVCITRKGRQKTVVSNQWLFLVNSNIKRRLPWMRFPVSLN